ncbi:hypothetical protein BJ165DRAFT_631960 [Panaeolus papilionaceus]|nr:hypothetical protein BJ165DRAFT_631960 [Panaeolus papilionaceus]
MYFSLTDILISDLSDLHVSQQVPFDFQQALSTEKTPTLGYAIKFFNDMFSRWRELQTKYRKEDPNASEATVIQDGIDKLQDYYNRIDDVPAYVMAMVLNPELKLTYFEKCAPHKVAPTKQLVLELLSPYYNQHIQQAKESHPIHLPPQHVLRLCLAQERQAYHNHVGRNSRQHNLLIRNSTLTSSTHPLAPLSRLSGSGRTINCVTLPYFVLPWTTSPSKALLSLVNGFSHQLRRP